MTTFLNEQQNKKAKEYEILCIPCLQIYNGGCSEHPYGCKHCTYCTEEGCDFNICPDRKDDEDLIFEFEEARKKDKSFPCEQIVALAYERINNMHQRLRILSEVSGLKGLQFLKKAKEILSNPDPIRCYPIDNLDTDSTKTEKDVSLCLDCIDFISCNNYYKCSEHSHMKNRCLTCRQEGHIYQTCSEWLRAKDTVSLFNSNDKDDIQAAEYIIIDTLTRSYIIHSLKTKSSKDDHRTNLTIRDDAVYDANTAFKNGRY